MVEGRGGEKGKKKKKRCKEEGKEKEGHALTIGENEIPVATLNVNYNNIGGASATVPTLDWSFSRLLRLVQPSFNVAGVYWPVMTPATLSLSKNTSFFLRILGYDV